MPKVCLVFLLVSGTGCTEPADRRVVVPLGNCRCGDVARTQEHSPVLLVDVQTLPVRPVYRVEVIDSTGRAVASGIASRSTEDTLLFQIGGHLAEGVYMVRIDDLREMALRVEEK